MATAYDLFSYPQTPGFKARDTAQAAAESMKPKAAILREKVLIALDAYGPLTADECAERLRIDKLSIRPRFSELSADGLVGDSGVRRPNASGKAAVVWTLLRRRAA